MKAEEVEVERLFKNGDQLLVPAWQRRYAWRQTQWDELWRDLERLEEGADTSHFVGSVVLHAQEFLGLASEAHRFLVVDGQQRVATLTVLICAVRDRIARLQSSEAERTKVRESYTAQLLRNGELDVKYHPRLVLQEVDQAALVRIISGSVDAEPNTLLEKAYIFFAGKLAARDEVSAVRLLQMVRTRLSAVWVVLQPGDNAHRVFQTLNAGGKALEQVDLVRNFFFLLLGEDGDEFYDGHWRQLETTLSSQEMKSYLVAWSVSRRFDGVEASLFNYIQKDLSSIENRVEDVIDYGRQFVDGANLYRWFKVPYEDHGLTPSTARTLRDIWRWGTIPSEGLLLHLMRLHDAGRLEDHHLGRAGEVILSFMARRFLAGYAPNRHKSIFVRATHKLLDRPDVEGQDVVDLLRAILSLGEDENIWPSDSLLRERVASGPIYTKARAKWVFVILERINRMHFKYEKHALGSLDDSVYTVEHIMPQKLSKRWEADLASWGVDSAAQLHETHLHVLGNLTLSAINSNLQNRPLREKLRMLSDDVLKLNAALVGIEQWDASAMDNRGHALIELAIEAFESPLSREEAEQVSLIDSATLEAETKLLEDEEVEELEPDPS